MMDGWKTYALEEIVVNKGLVRGPFGGALKKDSFVSDGYKVYEQKNAIYGTVNLGNYFIVEGKFNELKRFAVNPGDFIVSCSGTIGKIFQIPQDAPKGVINQALLKISIDETIINPTYFYYYFNWSKFQSEIIDNTQGGAMQNLVGMEIFRRTKLLLPPMDIQIQIVSILQTWDEYLEKLDKKIELAQIIHDGLMFMLLEGRTRIPGFNSQWSKHKLGEVVKIEKGKALTANGLLTGEIPVIAGGKTSPYNHDSHTHENVITVSASGAYAGYVSYHPYKIWASDCSVIEGKDAVTVTEYIYHYLKYKQKRIYLLQSGGAQPHIYPADLKTMQIILPSIKEQIAIAELLTTSNKELAALKRHGHILANQKQYLVTKLISGKIRTEDIQYA